ncbi:MAG: 4Fe-4S ferredoxin [Verrucomicrobiota bacterium]|jgi:electron-transferring-flavoprotein dehydrogenase|nr:4Fe-4S ferredoxin [Verrucomicrobiota bacterium]MDD8051815.1 4Fe-4S ferredoxin [Verrucomicrobiota bacterium]
MEQSPQIERQCMDVDIVCAGFGPAMGGFLTTLSKELVDGDGQPKLESGVMPGLPLQVLCYERADDVGFGVSGVVSRARGIRDSFPDLDPSDIPMAHEVTEERMLYLLDPVGIRNRPWNLKAADRTVRALKFMLDYDRDAVALPFIPGFLKKEPGLVFSIGQFNQWVSSRLMESGMVQLWPGTPIHEPLIEDQQVVGVRLMDQGTDAKGEPEAGFMPGMDIRARLTVVGDGPVGSVGQALDRHFGLPEGHHQREWAVGMKMLVDLPEGCPLQPGTVFHTLGYPEPEIFGFLYVHPGGVASLGIFVPTWFDSPTRTAYRYMQHWMRHPYLWRYLEGGTLRSWGAKTLQESGRQGEPHLVGDGYARIGEGSGSTNVLTGSGVDEAWTTGVLLAEAVAALWREGKPMTRENLRATYVRRRRESWVEQEGRVAEHARDGFQRGFLRGLIGMAMAGWTGGQFYVPGRSRPPHARVKSLEDYYRGIIPEPRLAEIRSEAARSGSSLHDVVMKECGWPEIPYDGKLLISQQDALLVGGKVQAPAGYKDHVVFLYPQICERCENKVCIEMCSAQAITPGEDGGVPDFEREKCVHCGVCLWNCSQAGLDDPEHGAIRFESGAGGLHSAEN